MTELTVGIRELKARLSAYMRQVKAGSTVTVTERGKPIGHIVPPSPSPEARVVELAQAGVVIWSGHRLAPLDPVARTSGPRTVADLLLENRE